MTIRSFLAKHFSPFSVKAEKEGNEFTPKVSWVKLLCIIVPVLLATAITIVVFYRSCKKSVPRSEILPKIPVSKSSSTNASATQLPHFKDFVICDCAVSVVDITNPDTYFNEMIASPNPIFQQTLSHLPALPQAVPLNDKSSFWECLSFIYQTRFVKEAEDDMKQEIAVYLMQLYSDIFIKVLADCDILIHYADKTESICKNFNILLSAAKEMTYEDLIDILFKIDDGTQYLLQKLEEYFSGQVAEVTESARNDKTFEKDDKNDESSVVVNDSDAVLVLNEIINNVITNNDDVINVSSSEASSKQNLAELAQTNIINQIEDTSKSQVKEEAPENSLIKKNQVAKKKEIIPLSNVKSDIVSSISQSTVSDVFKNISLSNSNSPQITANFPDIKNSSVNTSKNKSSISTKKQLDMIKKAGEIISYLPDSIQVYKLNTCPKEIDFGSIYPFQTQKCNLSDYFFFSYLCDQKLNATQIFDEIHVAKQDLNDRVIDSKLCRSSVDLINFIGKFEFDENDDSIPISINVEDHGFFDFENFDYLVKVISLTKSKFFSSFEDCKLNADSKYRSHILKSASVGGVLFEIQKLEKASHFLDNIITKEIEACSKLDWNAKFWELGSSSNILDPDFLQGIKNTDLLTCFKYGNYYDVPQLKVFIPNYLKDVRIFNFGGYFPDKYRNEPISYMNILQWSKSLSKYPCLFQKSLVRTEALLKISKFADASNFVYHTSEIDTNQKYKIASISLHENRAEKKKNILPKGQYWNNFSYIPPEFFNASKNGKQTEIIISSNHNIEPLTNLIFGNDGKVSSIVIKKLTCE